ncbi:MAG: 4Fe-4S dicluster domain-containing protein [Nitrospina sp.]|jgi:ferredoxin-type protein NapG|nr:4Fe-4S dicluster domain-containing protein [Nitrospina sp.]MBT5633697.1 4Fe-4S dicluster domain-containing protein [Nitrospina sp.]
MKFRHHLAKKTFKGKKKNTERGVEDLIDPDQRGNHSSAEIEPNPLSLDRETITPKEPVEETPREMSRRDMFSFGNFLDFGTAVEDEAQQSGKSKIIQEDEEVEDPAESAEEIESVEETVEKEPAPKKGFFKRLISKFKSDPEEEELSDQSVPETQPDLETTAVPTEDPADLQVSNNIFELEEAEDPEYDRRNLLRQGVHFFAKPAMDHVQGKIDSVNKAVDKITKRVPLLRPPGAISEKKFLQACSRCDECIHACPKDAILRAPKKMGFLVFNTPYIDPMRNPCVMCTDLPCISACPDGALLPVQELTDVNMGYAILDKKKCQAYGDTFCQQCVIDCPVPGAIHQVDDKPIIDKNICTGCGVCMRSCSTVNIPLAIKIKPQMVVEYQLHKKRTEQELARIEAEQRAQEKDLISQNTEEANLEP